MAYVLKRNWWQRQPDTLTYMDFGHPLSAGFSNPRAFYYIFNSTSVIGGYDVTTASHTYDVVGNNNFGTSKSTLTDFPVLYSVPPGGIYGNSQSRIYFNNGGLSKMYVNTGVLLDTTINDHGTVYWGQDPNSAFNDSTIRPMWGETTGSGTPEFSAQCFSDNNLYIGWNGSGTDARINLANSASYWTTNRLDHWALTWQNGAKSNLYINGVLIGTGANNAVVSAFSGSDVVAIGSHGGIAEYYTGSMSYFAITGAVHTQDMIEAWSDNPYQMFARSARRTYFAASVGDTLMGQACL